MKHRTIEELNAGLDPIRQSPKDAGTLDLIVRRPSVGERETVQQGRLDPLEGLVGDSWRKRFRPRPGDDEPDPDTQLNVMNSRVIELVAQDRSRWPLAGDQLFVDLDLSEAEAPAGTRLAIGTAVIEITSELHAGCGKFAARFGLDAVKFVNSPLGQSLRLRGVNARVVQAGDIRVGDAVRRLPPAESAAR